MAECDLHLGQPFACPICEHAKIEQKLRHKAQMKQLAEKRARSQGVGGRHNTAKWGSYARMAFWGHDEY